MIRCLFLICMVFVCPAALLAAEPEPPALIKPVQFLGGHDLQNLLAPQGVTLHQPAGDFRYSKMVYEIAGKYGVHWRLVAAVVQAESNFNSRATSSKGARGLMQLMPRTASRYQVKADELYDPYRNLEAGVQHLKMLIHRYAGNLELAIAAYNTGEYAVDRYGGVPPFRSTRYFVKKVLNHYLSPVLNFK